MPTSTAILLVEDDPNDVLFLKTALEEVGVRNSIRIVSDGKQALAYFEGAGVFSDRRQHPLPYLVLLDLKLPHIMGLDVLKWIRQRPQFDATIILILSASASPEDIASAYHAGANAYLVKPSTYDKLRVLVRALKEFWLIHNHPGPGLEE